MPTRPGTDLAAVRAVKKKQRKKKTNADRRSSHADAHHYVMVTEDELKGVVARRLLDAINIWSPEHTREVRSVYKSTARWLGQYADDMRVGRSFSVFEQLWGGATTGMILFSKGARAKAASSNGGQECVILRTLVMPGARRGSGTALVQTFIHQCGAVQYRVEASQCTATLAPFYKSLGFFCEDRVPSATSVLVLDARTTSAALVRRRTERNRLRSTPTSTLRLVRSRST